MEPRDALVPLVPLVFGPRALEIEPRALCAGEPPWRSPERSALARIDLRAGSLGAGERQGLERRGGSFSPGGERPSPRVELRIPLAGLEEEARESDAGRILLAAWRNAATPPGPARLVGIVNATPDSFSDGGRFLDPPRAIERGLELFEGGADVLDVGGESTRPGSEAVPEPEEMRRVLPVVEGLRAATDAPISVDTRRASVARAALDAGATIVNDVSAGRDDPLMLTLVAETGCELVLMHRLGIPRTMQRSPTYADVVGEVLHFLRGRAAAAIDAGVQPERLVVDPGLGFGKTPRHNLECLLGVPELRGLGLRVLIGASRKSFLEVLGAPHEPALRDPDTAGAVAVARFLGAELHRVHDAPAARAALRVPTALEGISRG